MLKEFLKVFEKELEENPNLILERYIPKDGKYLLVEMNGDDWKVYPYLEIKYDKNEETQTFINEENYSLIKKLDYYSNLLEINKPVDSRKTVHSSNYYSFACL